MCIPFAELIEQRILIQGAWGGAPDAAFLASAQEMLLAVSGSYLE